MKARGLGLDADPNTAITNAGLKAAHVKARARYPDVDLRKAASASKCTGMRDQWCVQIFIPGGVKFTTFVRAYNAAEAKDKGWRELLAKEQS